MTTPLTLIGRPRGRRIAGILTTDAEHAHQGSVPDPGIDTRGGTPGNVTMREDGGGPVLVPGPVGGTVVGVAVRGEGVTVTGVGVAVREVGVTAGGTRRSQLSLLYLKSTVAKSRAS